MNINPVKYFLWYIRDAINWQSEPYNYMLPKWGRPDGHPYSPHQAEIQLSTVIKEIRDLAHRYEYSYGSISDEIYYPIFAEDLKKFADKLEQL